MRTNDFDYPLPPELVAQTPAPERAQSRLLVLPRSTGQPLHQSFTEFPQQLQPGDLLVLNDSRVIPARLRSVSGPQGGAVEILLLEENQLNDWWVMVRPGKRARLGTQLLLVTPSGQLSGLSATVTAINAEGHRRLTFTGTPNLALELEHLGEIPLPPYIKRRAGENRPLDLERYQTVYAQADGSVAAPTAGLHLTQRLLEELRQRGVAVRFVTLHVGLGTFAPVKSETLAGHVMHEERFVLPVDTAEAINLARRDDRRVVAVGTTTVRVLESVAAESSGPWTASAGRTRIFIHPPFRFRIVDALLTNFHLPRSTLLMLVSAFAAPGETSGRETVLRAYAEAVRERYRFFSYGDAMFIH